MDIEHFDCLSWFSDKRESHEQDGVKLPFATTSRIRTASSDPAMAIRPSSGLHTDSGPVALIGSLCCRTNGVCTLQSANETRGTSRAQVFQWRIPSRSINSL